MIRVNGKEVVSGYFPAGEAIVNVLSALSLYEDLIEWMYNDDGELIELALIVDAIRRVKGDTTDIILSIPYIPYGRQDRVANQGEPLSIRVVASLINSLDFKEVWTVDPHSDVTNALFNNLNIEEISPRFYETIQKYPGACLVSPDAGATKRVEKVARAAGVLSIIQCTKVRETTTGKLSGFAVHSDSVGDSPLVVVDDICDGGGTFVGLAPLLRKITTGPLILYVSHGLFTKGKEELLKHYTEVVSAYDYVR